MIILCIPYMVTYI